MRKILGLMVVVSIFALGSFDLKDYLDGFSNTTPASSTWSLEEGTLVTGGNYEYRYNFSGNLKPIFAAKAPSIKIGCGSISIDGGFLAFLGLDDIETQFTDASAAFAFGFMSALELTMPEIAAIIHKLQQWARMLQQLLANACEYGKKAGNALFSSLWNSSSTDTPTFIGITANPAQQESEWSNAIDNLWPGSGDGSDIAESKKKDTVKKTKKAAGGASMLLAMFGNYLPSRPDSASVSDGLVVLDAELKDFLSSKKIGDKTLNVSDNAFSKKKDIYLLIRILFGEVFDSDASIGYVKRYFNADGTTNPDALKQDIKTGVYGGDGGDINMSPGFLKGTPYSPEDIANALMFGFNKINGGGSNIISIPNNKLIYVDAKIDTGVPGKALNAHDANSSTVNDSSTGGADENTTQHTVKTLLVQDNKSNDIDIEFVGFRDGSKLAIEAKVKDNIHFDWTEISVPNAVPGMGRYLKTLRTLYKKDPADLVVDTLINNLAELNAYYVATSFLSQTDSMVRYHKNNAKVALSTESVKLLRDNLAKLSAKVKKIKKALIKKIPKLSDMPSVNKDFEMLEKQIKEEISKALGE